MDGAVVSISMTFYNWHPVTSQPANWRTSQTLTADDTFCKTFLHMCNIILVIEQIEAKIPITTFIKHHNI